jgi:hypothetical protein
MRNRIYGKTKPHSDDVKNDTSKKPDNGIRHLKRIENLRDIRVAKMKLVCNHRGQNRKCLPANVVNYSREEERPGYPPAQLALTSFVLMARHLRFSQYI